MNALVADASVISSLAFGEPRAEKAKELLRGARLYEPLLLPFELVSVARKKCLAHPEKETAIRSALELALTLDIHWVEADFPLILKMALETGLSTYDTTYLHVARLLKVPLATFDEQLARAAPFAGVAVAT